jgi:hypothetical protein
MNTIATAARFRGIIRVALSFAVVSVIALATQPAFAASDSKETGELLVARGVTINGTAATGGLTIVSGSQIKTKPDGRAIVNLGKLGRVMLGSDSEIVLRFANGKLSGDMTSGWAVVSAPKGVEIAINTANGIAAADGDASSVMRVDLTGGTTRVETQSSAKLISGRKTEVVAAGEELEFAAADAGGDVAINRRPIESGSVVEVSGLSQLVATSVRAALETVILDRTLATPTSSTRPTLDLERQEFFNDTKSTQLVEQQVTCGQNGIICTPEQQSFGCTVLPIIVKAKAGCSLGFILQSNNTSPMNVSIRPYMGGACFRLTPTYPQTVVIPPGGTYPATINAKSCPKNAYQFAANKMIIVESDLCGLQYIRIEWANPCN